jgi:asparagine synthase (glutamine-hydrolysing)
LDISYNEAKNELHTLLKSAYNYRMVSDVPVGIFLSGGYDSASVAAILQSTHSRPLKTFTIGFREGNNEAPYAKQIAEHLGTDHNEYYCTEKECLDIIPELPYYFDEPFADSSAIPTTLVSRFAKEQVTVALSADAGDEVFSGYHAYMQLEDRISKLSKVPGSLRPILKNILQGISKIAPYQNPSIKHKLYGLSKAMNNNDLDLALGLFHESKKLPIQYRKRFIKEKGEELLTKFEVGNNEYDCPLEMIMAIDYQTYLQNDILVKVDRATMSTSLEGREPLVDHRILEFAAQLPLSYKFDGKTPKRILKDIVHEYIPKEMMDRPKSGFSLPIYKWLQNDLSYLVEEHLSPESLSLSGLFNVDFLNKQIDLFKKDKFHYKPFIWKLLMFQMWYKKWM